MTNDDLLGEDLFASELDDDFGGVIPEDDELDPLDDPLLDDEELADDEDGLGFGEEDEDMDYDGGYNPDEWN